MRRPRRNPCRARKNSSRAINGAQSRRPFPDSKKHTPKYVTIHHAGVIYKPGTDPAKFVKNMQAWGQKDKGWPDLPYHFLIAPDGRIFEARDMAYEPDTNTKYQLAGHIGVEMMGDFNQQRPSPQQLDSCARIVAWICDQKKIDIANIATHKDVAKGQTSCPGNDFYRYMESGEFKEWVTSILQGKEPQIDPGPPLDGGPTVIVGEGLPATKPDDGDDDEVVAAGISDSAAPSLPSDRSARGRSE
jgi:hypothetical protein